VRQDEKDIEQKGSCEGSGFLERFRQGGERESWQGMPQMKELKELRLLVSNDASNGGYSGIMRGDLITVAVSAVFLLFLSLISNGNIGSTRYLYGSEART